MAGVKGSATVELNGNIRHKTIAQNDKEIPGMLSSEVITVLQRRQMQADNAAIKTACSGPTLFKGTLSNYRLLNPLLLSLMAEQIS